MLATVLAALIFSTVTYAWISKNDTVTFDKVRMTLDVDKLKVGGVTFGDGVSTNFSSVSGEEIRFDVLITDDMLPG